MISISISRLDTDDTYFITGFRPNATMMTAHHMLVFGCEEPGSSEPVWNCGEMATKQSGTLFINNLRSKYLLFCD